MRVVSLLPAATEWIAAIDAVSMLVGRSHECDEPPVVRTLPAVTRPRFDTEGDSASLDARVQEQLRQGLSLYEVDFEALRALEPDLVLTQAQCEVCAASLLQLQEALADWVEGQPEILSLEPMTLKQVLDQALRIGRAVGHQQEAMKFIAEREKRLKHLCAELGIRRETPAEHLPSVACIEWLEPLMTAGHWVPDLVEMAGGRAVLSEGGEPSSYVEWSELREADPDVLVLAPCGFTMKETMRDLHYLTGREGWPDLQAVRSGRVYLLDGNAYFNRPGPRLYRSVELLAAALYPERLPAIKQSVASWELRSLEAVKRGR